MFYENFEKTCRENGISPTATLKKLKISTSKLTAWKNGSMPNSEFLIPISEFLGVSIDYLLTGKEKAIQEPLKLTKNEQELLELFGKFTDREQIKIIGRIEEWLAERERRATAVKQNIQTAYVAARSFDNAPPRIVTGDFSDVLNAPDSTDEY